MSDNAAFMIGITILAIAFTGEPDLVDSIIYYLTDSTQIIDGEIE
jgi:hypothetical protein